MTQHILADEFSIYSNALLVKREKFYNDSVINVFRLSEFVNWFSLNFFIFIMEMFLYLLPLSLVTFK